MQLANKRILLTGATGGLGQALAHLLAAQGVVLALVGRDIQKLTALQHALRRQGAQASIIMANLAEPGSVAELLTEAKSLLGEVDILINNAGVIDFTAIETQSDEKIAHIIQTNVTATLQLTRGLIAPFKARNAGHIVFVGSIFGSLGFPHFATYCASKFAVHGFSQALRRELVDTNIGITYVAPRAIATPMNDDRTNAMWQASGQAVDDPQTVAQQIVQALIAEKQELFIGQPQSFFAWLNGLAPRLVNLGLKSQAKLSKKYL